MKIIKYVINHLRDRNNFKSQFLKEKISYVLLSTVNLELRLHAKSEIS